MSGPQSHETCPRGGRWAKRHWTGLMLQGRTLNEQRVTFEAELGHLRTRDFAVLSTVGEESTPRAAGVNCGVSGPDRGLVIYVMTRTHLRKARNIAQSPSVSLVAPLTRRPP